MNIYPYLSRRIRKLGPKIDIGCGNTPQVGHIGIDVRDLGQDIIWDVREGLPFADNSITGIYTSHFVEHLTEPEIHALFAELLRVCAPGAVMQLKCPHASTIEAFYHCHSSYWNERRIKGLCAGLQGGNTPGGKFFKILSLKMAGIELQTTLQVVKKP